MLRDYFTTLYRWLGNQIQKLLANAPNERQLLSSEVAAFGGLRDWAQRATNPLPQFVQESSVALHYLQWLGQLDWQNFPERKDPAPSGQKWRGPDPQATAPFVAAWLIKVDRKLPHMTDLRQFLVEHPALTWVWGFPLTPSADYRWGFDVEASLPSHHHFTRLLRQVSNASLQFLLTNTVQLIQQELPANLNFGDEISLDTKHIMAWVRENNPKEFIKGAVSIKKSSPKAIQIVALASRPMAIKPKQSQINHPQLTFRPQPPLHNRPAMFDLAITFGATPQASWRPKCPSGASLF